MDMPNARGWRTHGGYFSQTEKITGRESSKWSHNGLVHEGLQYLRGVLDFSTLYGNAPGLVRGVERLANVENLCYRFEFYLHDEFAELGAFTAQLVSGGAKAKRAREKATLSVRAKWYSTSGTHAGRQYAGWVKLLDPRSYTVARVDINEVRSWAETLERELSAYWRAYNSPEGPGWGKQMDTTRTFVGKVMYSANLLRAQRLPLQTIAAVHLRVLDFGLASSMLRDFDAETRLEDFDFNRLHTLYS